VTAFTTQIDGKSMENDSKINGKFHWKNAAVASARCPKIGCSFERARACGNSLLLLQQLPSAS